MQDFVDVNGPHDLGRKRSLTLENGNKIHFEQKDPYGFWYVHYDKGQMPEKLQGAYTSFERAMTAVQCYLTEKKPEPEKNEKPVKAKTSNAA